MNTILIADDKQDELRTIKDILEKEGRYTIVTASSPDIALELMKPSRIRVAVLDYRLTDGEPDDESGLLVAQNSSSQIPKIMISAHAEQKDIEGFFGTDAEGHMIVFAFVSKEEIIKTPEKLLQAVERALEARLVWDQRERDSIQGQLLTDYKIARRWDHINTGLALSVNLIFLAMLVYTLLLIHTHEASVLLAGSISVAIIVSEVVVTLFLSKRIEGSTRRAENYHTEVLQSWRLEQLLRSADSLDYLKNRNEAKREIISAFANRWNTNTTPGAQVIDKSAILEE